MSHHTWWMIVCWPYWLRDGLTCDFVCCRTRTPLSHITESWILFCWSPSPCEWHRTLSCLSPFRSFSTSIAPNMVSIISQWMTWHPFAFLTHPKQNPSSRAFLIESRKSLILLYIYRLIHVHHLSPLLMIPLSAILVGLFLYQLDLSFSNHISNFSRYCFMHIRVLRHIRPILDFKTASDIATSIVHSKLDYCNSLLFNLRST